MVLFWGKATNSAAMSAQFERLRAAERVLIELAFQQKDSSNETSTATIEASSPLPPVIQSFDTHIPASCLNHSTVSSLCSTEEVSTNTVQTTDESYCIHGISIISSNTHEKEHRCDKPLVLLHGYMNGGAYFYRNFLRLSQHFTKIYALDQLGWGLSSRPSFSTYFTTAKTMLSNRVIAKNSGNLTANASSDEKNETRTMVRIAEAFFVESLEAWRKAMNIDSMVLAGHSMGGLIAVAYTEKYPQHVHQLILISPVGVPEETPAMIEARAARTTWRFRLFETLFPFVSPGDILRSIPESIGKNWIQEYVIRRLPAITNNEEQDALSEFLYCYNGLLPGSGEYCLPKILKPSVFGRLPLIHRIPSLRIGSCSFLYGETDWMDSSGGLGVEAACNERKLQHLSAPTVDVYQVGQAGHLLMLENSEEFNYGLIMVSLLNEESRVNANCTLKADQLDVNSDVSLPKRLQLR